MVVRIKSLEKLSAITETVVYDYSESIGFAMKHPLEDGVFTKEMIPLINCYIECIDEGDEYFIYKIHISDSEYLECRIRDWMIEEIK
jgi:hypothetical protein